jgi:hypothetical protein
VEVPLGFEAFFELNRSKLFGAAEEGRPPTSFIARSELPVMRRRNGAAAPFPKLGSGRQSEA